MLDILLTTLPIYLLILVGFASVRSGYLDGALIGALGQFTLKVALIALIFRAVALPRDATLSLPFMAAYVGASILTMVVGYALVRLILRSPPPEGWILAMGMGNSNSGFLGFPIAALVFGPEAATVFAMTMTVENVLTLPFAILAAGLAGQGGRIGPLLAQIGRQIVSNPLLIGVALALAVRISGLPLGAPVESAIVTLAGAAGPLALFVIGGTMARLSISGHWRRTSAITLGKLVLHPALVALALLLVPGVPPALIPVGILFAAVPMLTIYPLLATPFGLGAVTSTALVVSTAISVLSVSLVLNWVL